MRQTFNVLFFIRKTRALKSGENPIMLRISIDGQLAEMQLKRAVKPNLWNHNKERCTGKDATSIEINRYLDSVKLRLLDIHRNMELEKKLINPMEIKRKFLGLDEEHKMFFQVFQEHNDKCRELIGIDYAKVTISRSVCKQRRDIFKEVANSLPSIHSCSMQSEARMFVRELQKRYAPILV